MFQIIYITCYQMHRFLDINQVSSPRNFQFGYNNVDNSLYMMRRPQYKETSKDSHCKKVKIKCVKNCSSTCDLYTLNHKRYISENIKRL